MPVIPSPDLPMCRRRDIYLEAVAKAYQPTLDILIESITAANPDLARYIHFPFWSIGDNAELVNWYLRYDPPKSHVWHYIKELLGLMDRIIAIHFDGSNVVVMSHWGIPKAFKKTFNLAHPDSFHELGKHIFKLLV